MKHPIVVGGKIGGFVVGNLTYTFEKNFCSGKVITSGLIAECYIHPDFSPVYEKIGEPESIFDIHILNDDGSERVRLEKLILFPPSCIWHTKAMVIISNCNFSSF